MTRQEWRGRLHLTGDPEVDRANREAMLDRLAESIAGSMAAFPPMRNAVEDLGDGVIRVGAYVGIDPARQIEAAPAADQGEEQ